MPIINTRYRYINYLCLILFLLFSIINCSSNIVAAKKQSNIKSEKSRVILPADFKVSRPLSIKDKNEILDIYTYSRGYAQGEIIYIECYPKKDKNIAKVTCSLLKKKITLTKKPWGYRGIIAIPPQAKPISTNLNFNIETDEKNISEKIIVKVADSKFKTVYKAMDMGKYSNRKYMQKKETTDFIKRSTALKKKAFAHHSPDYIGAVSAHPRNMHYITSPFWFKRVYKSYIKKNNKKVLHKKSVKTHRGLDLRGKVGTPVYAMQSGTVVLANKLFFEGNMVIIDHGKHNFSYYMHLHSMKVKPGDVVKAGKIIGTVGKTGRVTGAHLHVSFVIDGVQVDPLSLLYLPIKN